jgi:hypothetical protein
MSKVSHVADEQPLVEAGYHYEDRFFDETEGIVAVFDFDYEKIIAFDWDVAVATWTTSPCIFPLLVLFCEPQRPDSGPRATPARRGLFRGRAAA